MLDVGRERRGKPGDQVLGCATKGLLIPLLLTVRSQESGGAGGVIKVYLWSCFILSCTKLFHFALKEVISSFLLY